MNSSLLLPACPGGLIEANARFLPSAFRLLLSAFCFPPSAFRLPAAAARLARLRRSLNYELIATHEETL